MDRYSDDELYRMAFDENSYIAFNASIELARRLGIPENLILKSVWDIDKFFMD